MMGVYKLLSTVQDKPKICLPYGVELMKFAQNKTESKTCKPLLLDVSCNQFNNNKILLTLKDEDEEDFKVQSIKVTYEFSKEQVPSDRIKCILESRVYSFFTSAIKFHILYGIFECEIGYEQGDKSFEVLYQFNIPFFAKRRAVRFSPLDDFFPNESFINIFNCELKADPCLSTQEHELLTKINGNDLTSIDGLKTALHIEDLTQQDALKQYTLINVKLEKGKRGSFKFHVDREKLSESIEETSLCLIPMEKFSIEKFVFNKEDDCIFVFIDKFKGNTIEFKCKKGKVWKEKNIISLDVLYAIRFVPNRISIRAGINALNTILQKNLTKYFELFEEIPIRTMVTKYPSKFYYNSDFNWYNKNIETNYEQKLAIKNIVNCTAYPFPYCIFGPPGTGKTSCIVECALQILKLNPNSKILITAQSNSACNEIGERLLRYTSNANVFRLYSSRMQKINPGGVSEGLVCTSNLRNRKESQFPFIEELKHFPIVICTLTTSSQLVRASLFNHFDYIFIDESAATNEPESCIPLVGLGCENDQITANFILIGDHRQLRPVITSTFARDHLKLGVSLMERIMTTKRYQKKPAYDTRYVTQLLNNYRSHPAILNFSNKEFYDSALRAKNTSEEVYLGTKWNDLPNKKFPIVFHCVKTSSEIDKGFTSSHNKGEIEVVRQYVEKLLVKGIGEHKITAKDIGVISPYKAQLERFRKVLPSEVETGSAEYYQGREKLIIIISTVKSNANIGFLKDERRLNVCLTRAKALMIVVGNADTLQKDETWKRFIHYCRFNYACVGEKFYLKPLRPTNFINNITHQNVSSKNYNYPRQRNTIKKVSHSVIASEETHEDKLKEKILEEKSKEETPEEENSGQLVVFELEERLSKLKILDPFPRGLLRKRLNILTAVDSNNNQGPIIKLKGWPSNFQINQSLLQSNNQFRHIPECNKLITIEEAKRFSNPFRVFQQTTNVCSVVFAFICFIISIMQGLAGRSKY